MSNNRTEQQALIDALAATVDLSELQLALIQAGYLFKKDVGATVSVSGGTAAADFSTNDRVKVNTSTDATISVLSLEEGQIAKLVVIKGASNVITLSGVNIRTGSIDYGLTRVTYLLVKTDGQVIAYQIDDAPRAFSLSGSPGSGVSISTQNNYISGRSVYINLTIVYTGSEDTWVSIGGLPFKSEVNISGLQFLAIHNADTGIIEGAAAQYNPLSTILGKFGKTGETYYISGVILI